MTPERFRRLEAALDRRQPDLTVLTDDVHKSHNVAAIMRTCDAVGIQRLHAVAQPGEFRKHHMIAGGSKRWVDVRVHESIGDAYAELKTGGFTLLVADGGPNSIDFREIDYTTPTAVVLGAELYGPSDYAYRKADYRIAIPMQGMVESLNVSVAAAVILYEAERQRRNAGLYDSSRIDVDERRATLFEWAYPEIAKRCRRRGLAYPALDDDGALLENPFSASSS